MFHVEHSYRLRLNVSRGTFRRDGEPLATSHAFFIPYLVIEQEDCVDSAKRRRAGCGSRRVTFTACHPDRNSVPSVCKELGYATRPGSWVLLPNSNKEVPEWGAERTRRPARRRTPRITTSWCPPPRAEWHLRSLVGRVCQRPAGELPNVVYVPTPCRRRASGLETSHVRHTSPCLHPCVAICRLRSRVSRKTMLAPAQT